MITRLKIPAKYHNNFGHEIIGLAADFTLGKGPCGKIVTKLDISLDSDWVAVLQVHEDGSTKDFYYHVSQLFGRVEVERG